MVQKHKLSEDRFRSVLVEKNKELVTALAGVVDKYTSELPTSLIIGALNGMAMSVYMSSMRMYHDNLNNASLSSSNDEIRKYTG